MKNKRIVGAILAVVIAGTVGVLANVLTTNDKSAAEDRPTTSSTATGTPVADPTEVAPPTPDDATDLVLAPGTIGAVKVGMSKAEALATGLFGASSQEPVEGCPTPPLAWKAPFDELLDVQTLGNGEIASIGVRKSGPATADGLGVGSTYAEVQAAVADADAIEAGYDQSGVVVFDQETGGWIGYLFDAPLDELKAGDTVSFVELTKGSQPSLMRDGC